MFDPYRKWLGIPAGERPPTHYQLLGISPDECDADVIKAAVIRQSAYVRNFQTGKYAAEATRLLNEIGEAKVCLLDPARRAKYDSELRAWRSATSASRPVSAPAPVSARAPRPPNSGQAAAGLYGPDLAGSRLPGPGVSSSSGSMPVSPLRPPAGGGPAAVPPAPQAPARGAAHAIPSLEHDPLWQTLERAAGPAAPQTLLGGGRSSAKLPVWLWSLPLIAGALLAITLVVHFVGRRPARQVARTTAGASAPAAPANSQTATRQPSTPATIFDQGPSAGSSRPRNSTAASGGYRPPNVGAAPTNPPASASPFGGNGSRGQPPSDASGGGSAGASFDSGASAGNRPPTSSNPAGPRNVAPFSGSRPKQPRTPAAPPSDTNDTTTASDRGQFNAPPAQVSAASLADGSWRRIALAPGRAGPVFAQAAGPFVAVGSEVRHLKTGEVVGETGIAYGVEPLRALSADGEFYAVGGTKGIDVHRTDDGKTLHQIRGKNFGVRLEFLSFGAADRLIAVTTNAGQYYLQSWNLTTGKLSKDVMLEAFDQRATLSDDGKLLATPFTHEDLVIHDIGRSPSKGKAKVLARIPLPPPSNPALSLLDGLRFSPDGSELIASLGRGDRLVVWNQTGQVVLEEQTGFELEGFSSFGTPESAVEWDRAGRGWLLGGRIFFDRNLRRVTWMIGGDPTRSPYPRRHFIDANRLAVSSSRGDELIAVQIPWTKIEKSLAARDNAGTPAWLGPKQPVNVKFNLRDTGSDTAAETIEQDLKRLLVARLASDNITVATDQPATIAVDYSEHSRSARRPAGAPDFGQEIAIADEPPPPIFAQVTLTLLLGPDEWPFWKTRFVVMTHGSDAPSPRTALYSALQTRLQRTIFPYFVPKGDDDLVSLPLMIGP